MSVASPCTNVCQLDPRNGWCLGCRRTMHEISRWPHANDDERRAILARIEGRKQ